LVYTTNNTLWERNQFSLIYVPDAQLHYQKKSSQIKYQLGVYN
jgi:hypothetical protein